LQELCERHSGDLFKADLLIGSDGPRNAPAEPTIFLGARGTCPFELIVNLREGSHHSGNFGGLLANPGIILAHALASITDARGAISLPEWRPPLTASVRQALAGVEIDGGCDGPQIDRDWGEPGLTPAERVFGWNSFEILAFHTGTPERPVNAIPGIARAHCQLRYVVGTTSSLRCVVISIAIASGTSRYERCKVDTSTPAASIRPIHGWDGPAAHSRAPSAGSRLSCRISADRCPTTFLPTSCT
jgi:acetylornithine deacetylase/succinyl-diaminopimelate desuccinylase-like protein